MDISKYLLSGYQGLYKNQGAFGDSKAQRVERMNQRRKTNRHDLMMAKRNISSSDMTFESGEYLLFYLVVFDLFLAS